MGLDNLQALDFCVPKLDGMMSPKIWALPLPYITLGILGGINWGYGMVVGPILGVVTFQVLQAWTPCLSHPFTMIFLCQNLGGGFTF